MKRLTKEQRSELLRYVQNYRDRGVYGVWTDLANAIDAAVKEIDAMYQPEGARTKTKNRRQLLLQIRALERQIAEQKEQIHFLQDSVHKRNMRADKAERSEKAAVASFEAIRKLYVDG